MTPDFSRIVCTINPVLNLTLSPKPARREYLKPRIFLRDRSAARSLAATAAKLTTITICGAYNMESMDTAARHKRRKWAKGRRSQELNGLLSFIQPLLEASPLELHHRRWPYTARLSPKWSPKAINEKHINSVRTENTKDEDGSFPIDALPSCQLSTARWSKLKWTQGLEEPPRGWQTISPQHMDKAWQNTHQN